MIFDTDVLIWFMRGKTEAAEALASVPEENRFISVITYMELVQGVRDKAELRLLKEIIPQTGLNILPLSQSIGQWASELMDDFKLSSGLELADALIAATVLEAKQPFATANEKHYKSLGLDLHVFKP